MRTVATFFIAVAWLALVASSVRISAGPNDTGAAVQTPAAAQPAAVSAPPQALFATYCITCHNQRLRTAGLALDTVDVANPAANAEVWEKVIAKLRAGSMPPPGRPRPDAATYRAVATWLETELDQNWAANPNPGRIGAVHRSESRGIQQRDSRSPRARSRCETAAAGRRHRRRQLRQLRRARFRFRPRTSNATCPWRGR